MKVRELTGAKLDYWVAKANGVCPLDWNFDKFEQFINYSPSSDWSRAGPIIEWEHIMLEPGGPKDSWCAHIWLSEAIQWLRIEGPTPLIAAMRAYVASKFGEEVPDEPTS